MQKEEEKREPAERIIESVKFLHPIRPPLPLTRFYARARALSLL